MLTGCVGLKRKINELPFIETKEVNAKYIYFFSKS